MRHLRSVPAMRPPGSPRRGDLAGSNTSEPRGSAPRERDHRGGDHPVPSRTRQLSPPSPRVLQREAAGGQGVALAEGAFLMRAMRPARRKRREGPQGGSSPCGPSRVLRRRSYSGPACPAAPAARARGMQGRPTARPRWRSAARRAARMSRRRARRAISLAGLLSFGAQGDLCGGVLRGPKGGMPPHRTRRRAAEGSPRGPFRVEGDAAAPRAGGAPLSVAAGRLGRAAGVWHIRGMRPGAPPGNAPEGEARGPAGDSSCWSFRIFGRGLRLAGVPVCAALRGAPEGSQRGRSCGLFRVIGEGSPYPPSALRVLK